MKGKIISIISVVAFSLLLFPLAGCIESGSTAPAQPIVTATDQAQNTRLDNLTNELNTAKANIASLQARPTGANQADIDSLRSKVTALETEFATLKTQNTQMAADIAALKTGNSGITPPATGTVAWLTNPTVVQTLGSQQVCYTLKITNGTGQWVYIRPIININLHTGQSPLSNPITDDNITISMGGGIGSYAGSDFTVTGTTTSAILVSTRELQLGANTTADLLVCIKITTEDRIWDITSSVNWRSL